MDLERRDFIDRANKWAEKKGYKPLTDSTFDHWKKEKLIPSPKSRGRGRGKGKAEFWSYRDYYQLLKIMQMREKGIIHKRDQKSKVSFVTSETKFLST